MVNSLVAGLSGLRVHQQLLDVVGNNLANSNTPGYKGSRATFAEILTQLVRQGTAPSTNVGGTNPQQVGLGVRLGTVDVNMNQGSFVTTGRSFDLAIQGAGFFVVNDGTQDFFTRSGTFGLDQNNDLVDLKNGFKVQATTGGSINIDTTTLSTPQATQNIVLTGNLPAKVGGPLAQVLTTDSAFELGTAASVVSDAETFALANGDTLEISVNGATADIITFATASFADITAATAAEVAAVITAANITGLSASASAGVVTLSTTGTGADKTIKVTDGTGTPADAIGWGTAIVAGTSSAATLLTTLNSLPNNTVDYASGDQISIAGTNVDGTSINATFTYGSGTDGTTVGDLIDFINDTSVLDGQATAALDATTGEITITSATTGVTSLNLVIADGTGTTQVGSTNWAEQAFGITTKGTGPDTHVTSIPIFDTQGLAHTLTMTFERQDDLTWTMTASVPTADGTLDVSSVTAITFNDSGEFLSKSGTGALTADWSNTVANQNFTVAFDDLTSFGKDSTAQASSQDGFGPGALSTISVRSDGVIQGIFTNGQISTLGSIGVATFANPQGLLRVADTLFAVSTNSGSASLGAGNTGAAGSLQSGVLENSNVEVAEEFVKLVEAQRGFQASAKVIQTTDRLLADLNNLI